MKQHTTNYFDTFIQVAQDSKATAGTAPPEKDPKTAARIEYDLLIDDPYVHTSDDVLYESNGKRRGISREDFFAKGQPCFRASSLTKKYGWGVHSNEEGKIAIYSVDSPEYKEFTENTSLKHLKAMQSSKK